MKFDFWVLLKGMLMGAADIVPGVSGGTIAFITGIYERFLNALKSIVPEFLTLLKERKFSRFWKDIDGAFLLTLFGGIIISVLSLAKIITFLLMAYPIQLWSGFFGLILASVFIVGKEVPQWNLTVIMVFVGGTLAAYFITQATPTSIEFSVLNIFISGVLAICAMVLPGISGSFILVILGSYAHVLTAVKSLDLVTVGVFMAGCLVGILSIANLLSWAFTRFKSLTLALLTGFMLGALNKVWPWKEVLSYRTNRHGEQVPLIERNITPEQFEIITSLPSHYGVAVFCAAFAAIFVLLISYIAVKNEKAQTNKV